MEESNSELESFRRQWQAEVSGRMQPARSSEAQAAAGPSKPPRNQPHPPLHAAVENLRSQNNDIEQLDGENDTRNSTNQAGHSDDIEGFETRAVVEPQSALEHYEKAVEKEAQGNLGDSLDLYRKAFKVSNTTWPHEPY